MTIVFLTLAIICEVTATLSLRMAGVGTKIWLIPTFILYPVSFALLALTLSHGMTIGVAYGIWTASGVALTAIAGRVLFKERLTWVSTLGIALIAGGVILVEFGAAH
jgi:small multidrug resistance pump